MSVKLGSRVKDLISGFKGIAVAHSRWMYGCNRIVVEAEELNDGKPIDGQWFDEQRIETVQENAVPVAEPQKHDHIVMGNKYRDNVTGFEGVCQAITVWSSGNVTVSLEPTELKDGKPLKSEGFDVHRLTEVAVKEIPVSKENTSGSGGPQNDPKQAM